MSWVYGKACHRRLRSGGWNRCRKNYNSIVASQNMNEAVDEDVSDAFGGELGGSDGEHVGSAAEAIREKRCRHCCGV